MPNLIVTNACNLSCPFCFASEHLADGDARPADRMSLEQFAEALAFCGTEEVRLCGGEPTVHPDIVRMLDMALEERGRRVFFMTNGVWPESMRARVRSLSTTELVRVKYLFNILPPDLYTDAQWAQLLQTLGTVHPLSATLGITLYKAPMPYAHVLELARAYGIQRIRFSVASPNTTDPRSWNLSPERDFPRLAPLVHSLVTDARAMGLTVHSDCGYIPPCFFTAEQLKDIRGAMEFSCQGPLDVDAQGNAWRCYGLYNVIRGHTSDHDSCAELAETLERRTHEELSGHFMLDACATCDWRARGECMGGCFAYRSAKDMRQRAEGQLVRIGEDASLMAARPQPDAHGLRRLGGAPMVNVAGAWVPLDVNPLEQRVLEELDGARTVAEVAARLEADGTLRRAGPAVGRAVRKLFAQGAVRF